MNQPPVPYPPSWVDRLMARVDRLPGPAWLYYAGAALVVYTAYVLVKWWDGGVPVGTLPLWTLIVPSTAVYYLATVHYLDLIALDAVERFRAALPAPDARVAELTYRLTTMPPRPVWLVTLLGFLTGVATVVGTASGTLIYPGPPPYGSVPAALMEILLLIIVQLSFANAVYHAVHQLRTVSLLYSELTSVNLFDQGPLHAFARLAAYTALSWVPVQYAWLATSGLTPGTFRVALGFLVTAIILGALAFIWPLLGIHRLLTAEKERLESETGRRLQHSLQMFDQALERDDLAQMDAINDVIATAEREREIVAKLPTWPWRSDLLRNMLTAVLLPLVLWLITRLLERLLGP